MVIVGGTINVNDLCAMKPIDDKRQPFLKSEYGILYVIPGKSGSNVRTYRDEKDRDNAFERALRTAELNLFGNRIKVRHVVKFKVESPTYTADPEYIVDGESDGYS